MALASRSAAAARELGRRSAAARAAVSEMSGRIEPAVARLVEGDVLPMATAGPAPRTGATGESMPLIPSDPIFPSSRRAPPKQPLRDSRATAAPIHQKHPRDGGDNQTAVPPWWDRSSLGSHQHHRGTWPIPGSGTVAHNTSFMVAGAGCCMMSMEHAAAAAARGTTSSWVTTALASFSYLHLAIIFICSTSS